MTLLDKLYQIPKPIFIFLAMCIGLAFMMYDSPLADGCEVDVKNFETEARGILRGFRTKKSLTQFAVIGAQKNACRQGNSVGACENYFESLKKITIASTRVRDECFVKLKEDFKNYQTEVADGLKILSLIAWGAVPPKDSTQRLGWLSQAELYTFCRLKRIIQNQITEEQYIQFRSSIYAEYPQEFPEDLEPEKKLLMERPRALKSASNPDGRLTEPEVFERSLFSIRCDMYY